MTESMRQAVETNYRTMHSRLSSVIRREPMTVPPGTSLHHSLQVMEEHKLGSIVVAEPDTGVPVGIFTTQDLLRLTALQVPALDQPIDNVMTRHLVTLGPDCTAYDAALVMSRERLRHLLIVNESSRLLGVVSQNDLFSLQRIGIKEISEEISSAKDTDILVGCAADIRLLSDNMLAQGIGAEQLTHFISTLNDLLTLRLIELTRAEFDLPETRWCWIALGSEGRFEQTFSSDQDNGLIFEASDELTEKTRQRLLPFAQTVNRKLDQCGFLLCRGNIMAGNPMWCLSIKEWEQKFASWIASPTPQSLLNASIFFDFRPLYGANELGVELKGWLLGACKKNTLFLYHMAQDALQKRPPLGILREFSFEKSVEFPGTIDLKMYGAWPFVNAARILSIEESVTETSTAQRLRLALKEKHPGGSVSVAAMIDAFYFIQLLRLRHQHTLRGKAVGANRINPYDLNEFDRQILKEAFRQARKLQRTLRLAYQL